MSVRLSQGGGMATSEEIPAAELEAARRCWAEGRGSVPRPVQREHPMYVPI